jgi:3-hydroxyacyl-CoA dehydrogenase
VMRLTRWMTAVAVVTIDNPPVNALGFAVRQAMIEAMNRAEGRSGRHLAVVLTGGGRTFSGGADITEFGKPPREPSLPDVNTALRNHGKPVVAAIHGFAFGGGLEVSLVLSWPDRHRGCQAGACRSEARSYPWRRRYAAPAAADRAGSRARRDCSRKPVPGAKKRWKSGIRRPRREGDDLLAAARASCPLELAAQAAKRRRCAIREDRLEAAREDPSAFDSPCRGTLTQARRTGSKLRMPACVPCAWHWTRRSTRRWPGSATYSSS